MVRDAELVRLKYLARQGEFFGVVNAAREAVATLGDPDGAFRFQEVLALARTASISEAAEKYADYGFDRHPGLEMRALHARLLKDAALGAAGGQRGPGLIRARDAYLAIFRDMGDTYTGINAATLSVLAGAVEQGEDLAREVLSRLPRAADFWALVTEAEALLILGRQTEAKEILADAVWQDPGLADLAATLRQLRMLVKALGLDPDVLSGLIPPPVAHFTGHRISAPGCPGGRVAAEAEAALAARIGAAIDTVRPATMFGALACGADILFAEAALERGLDLRLVLPFDPEVFCDSSVRSGGPSWVARYRAVLAQCAKLDRVEVLDTRATPVVDAQAFGFAARIAMGRAALLARTIEARVVQIAAWDGRPADGPAGTGADVVGWRGTGRRCHVIDVSDLGADFGFAPHAEPGPARVERTLVFGDIKGYCRIHDSALPNFVEAVFGAIRAELDREAAALDYANTWGDAIFAVFTDVGAAARFSLAVQARIAALDRPALGLPGDLSLRIGLHAGVVWALTDPVTGVRNFFGDAVNRAARIEPVTREGLLFASEHAAALLELVPDRAIRAEYVGRVETAKLHGLHPLYRLRHALPDEQ